MNWVYLVPNYKTYCDKRIYKNTYVAYLKKLGYRCTETGDCFAEYPAAVIYEKRLSTDDGLGYNLGDIIYFMTSKELHGFDVAGIEYHIIPESAPEKVCNKRCKITKRPHADTCKGTPACQFGIKKVIFNDPATIVFWDDGTKTVVRCQVTGKNQHGEYREKYDKEKGLALCFAKKALGNTGSYNDVFKKWIE